VPVTPLRQFLSDVRNQILLAEDAVDLPRDLESVALPARVRLRAPRSLRLHVLLIALNEEHDALELLAAVGRRTELRIRWTLEEMQAVTGIELAVEFRRPTLPIRAFLPLGGARVLERRLEAALDSLGEIVRLAAAGGALDEADMCHIALTAHAVPRMRRPALAAT
jgi:hypothetical protein